ncbi:MAG: hypothetical protein J6127_06725 [Clostridiales bacterium]|nr:hypothetical protein [Clostridiales bacterium]
MDRFELNNEKKFSLAMLLMTVVMVLGTGTLSVEGMNADAFALNYRHGLIPRGFMGFILDMFCSVFGERFYTYATVFVICSIGFIIYLAVMWQFGKKLIVSLGNTDHARAFVMVIAPFFIAMFLGYENYGRTDMYLLALSLTAGYAVIKQKALILSVICPLIAILIHEGYVLTFFNIVVACFLYKIFTTKGKIRTTNIIFLIISVLTVGAAFIWFFFLSRKVIPLTTDIYLDTISRAEILTSPEGYTHYDFLNMILTGFETYDSEETMRSLAMTEMPLFIVLFLPVFKVCIDFVRKVYSFSSRKMLVVVLCLGSVTLLPEFARKCDVGRWMFAFITYYVILTVLLLIDGNKVVRKVFDDMINGIAKSSWKGIFFALYIMLFVPFQTFFVSSISFNILEFMRSLFYGDLF